MSARQVLATTVAVVALTATEVATGGPGSAATRSEAAAPRPVPEVLEGNTWIRHLRQDLLPYWELPVALGTPLGNFPTWRDAEGNLDPERGTFRGLSTLARGVFGYSVAFHLTGDEKYLTYARAGLEWIDAHGRDRQRGGWYRDLDETGGPFNRDDDKQLFDLASLGMAYGMYFNVTRDPWAERGLLEVRDLIFDKYYDPAGKRFFDSRTPDMASPFDTGGNGDDIVNTLVPGTALLLPNADLLTDPARRQQFRDDLRIVTDTLIARHRNTTAPETWWFWGRTGRKVHSAAQTDFGHTIKSHEMIYNANNMLPDRPWSFMAEDREVMLTRAWDNEAARWNDDLSGFGSTATIDRDSAWWIHDEADQTLAALDLQEDFARSDQLARSAQTWFEDFVDPTFPHEVWQRPRRDPALSNLEKSGRGKNMYHAFEHTLVMYLHGRAMQGLPAELHYALPADIALTAEAEPYWFDATTEHRVVGSPVGMLPGHRHVTVELSGLDSVPAPLYPPPADDAAPETTATLAPAANDAGWSSSPASLTLSATDQGVGVREVRAQVRDLTGTAPSEAWITPGDELTLPFTDEGRFAVSYAAVDRLGNTEATRTVEVRIDLAAPSVSGLPATPCRIWPPNGRMVTVADVLGADGLSGVADVRAAVTVDEPAAGDVEVVDGPAVEGPDRVRVRAVRDDEGDGRVYTITATVTDQAGNVTSATGTCTVPHDQRPRGQ